MKRIAMMLALMVALGGCAMMTEGLGGSNRVHFDATKEVIVELYGNDENGNRILVSKTTTTTGGVVTADTLAGIGRTIVGAAGGSVEYNAQTGVLKLFFDENAEIVGGVAQDIGAIFKYGFDAATSIAESENQPDGAAVAELNERLDGLEAKIDALLDATNEASIRQGNATERERIRAIIERGNSSSEKRGTLDNPATQKWSQGGVVFLSTER